MLYAVIMRFDSLREIVMATLAEARKLAHVGVTVMPHSKKGRKTGVSSSTKPAL